MVMTMDNDSLREIANQLGALDTPGNVIEFSQYAAKFLGAFKESAITISDAQLSAEIERRREIVNQVDAIHQLEGFTPEDAPDWYKELTEDYILGKVTAEAATQKALEFIKSSAF